MGGCAAAAAEIDPVVLVLDDDADDDAVEDSEDAMEEDEFKTILPPVGPWPPLLLTSLLSCLGRIILLPLLLYCWLLLLSIFG